MILIHHADHDVPLEAIGWALARVEDTHGFNGFFITTLTIPSYMTDLANALYGPACGDPPVPEDEVVYQQRSPDRPLSRMVHRPLRPTRLLTVIGVLYADSAQIYTAHGGPLAEIEPGDPVLGSDEAKFLKAATFWRDHALALPEGMK
jgi:hypothetical protein